MRSWDRQRQSTKFVNHKPQNRENSYKKLSQEFVYRNYINNFYNLFIRDDFSRCSTKY